MPKHMAAQFAQLLIGVIHEHLARRDLRLLWLRALYDVPLRLLRVTLGTAFPKVTM